MNIVNELEKRFTVGEPILLDEIRRVMARYSRSYIFECIRKAIATGGLSRYDESVYYIRGRGEASEGRINPRKVIEKKYIREEGQTIGFYTGIGLLNAIGGTRQLPSVYEVVTNKESMRKREVSIGRSRFILRRARCKITDENKSILEILELSNRFKLDSEGQEALRQYAKANGVTLTKLIKYSKYYPAKATKTAIEALEEQ